MSRSFPFFTSPHVEPSVLPLLLTPLPDAAYSPTFTTRDFLYLFPPHACTIMRSHRHHISSHQRHFHVQRLLDSITSFSTLKPDSLPLLSQPLLIIPPLTSYCPPITLHSIHHRLSDLCDRALATFPFPPSNELIVTLLFIPLPPSTYPAEDPPVPWCLLAHPRVVSPFPAHLPLIAVSMHPHQRRLPTRKHSQWIRDRQGLEAMKEADGVGELVMYEGEGGVEGGEVLEGLITNVGRVEEDGGLRVCRHGGRLKGYMETLLVEVVQDGGGDGREEGKEEGVGGGGGGGKAVREGLSVKAVQGGKAQGLYISGAAVCIAGVQRVRWKEGEVKREAVMGDEGLQRVDRLRVKLLRLMDSHVAADWAERNSQGRG